MAACSQNDPIDENASRRGPTSSPRQSEVVDSPSPFNPPHEPSDEDAVLYLDGKVLHAFDIEMGTSRRIDKLPSADATASLDGSRIAYVTSSAPTADDEDFVAAPELHVYEVESGRDMTIGLGFSPLWSPSGELIVYLEPEGPRACEGEVCAGWNALVTASVSTEQRTTLLEAGDWTPLGWFGERVVVSDRSGPTTSAVASSGEVEPLDIPTNEFWGSSPDGRWIVRSTRGEVSFLSQAGTEAERRVDLKGGTLGEGSWSPDASTIVAVSLAPAGRTSLAVLAPESQDALPVPDSEGAGGPVVWSADGSSFLYTRATGPGGLSLEAVVCESRDGGGVRDCSSLFTWPRGVTLLALL